MQRHNWQRHLAILGGAFLMLNLLLAPASHAAPPRQPPPDRVEQLLAGMTLRQQVGQLFMVSLWGEVLTVEGREFLTTEQPGGVILFGYNTESPAQITSLTNDIQATLAAGQPGIPAWIATDQEGGTVSRLTAGDHFTAFPVPMAVAATHNPDYAHQIGAAMAEELRAVGLNMDLAPVADVLTNPDNPVIDRRAFSSDPILTAQMTAAMIAGLQSGDVMATAKHFPGHGDTSDDSHLGLPTVPLDRSRLDAVELAPFRSAISADVGTIMVAHIWYPALEPTPDTPASLSAPVITDLLRGELSFEGLVMTDALDMDAIDARYTLADAALQAVQAGADLITPGPHMGLTAQRNAIDAVVSAVERGEIPRERITASARRVLAHKVAYGVLDWQPLDPASADSRINRAAHDALVADVLADAVTLVYDNTGQIPLDGTTGRIALLYPATLPSIARSCEAYSDSLWPVGFSEGPTDEERSWALGAAQGSELAVIFTLDAHLNRPLQRLVRSLPPERTIVVALRSPYDWELFPDVAAYITAYTPLPPAVDAACAALFGAQPLNGSLPVSLGDTWPADGG